MRSYIRAVDGTTNAAMRDQRLVDTRQTLRRDGGFDAPSMFNSLEV